MHWHLPHFAWWIIGPFLAWRVGVRLWRLLACQKYSQAWLWARAAGLIALVAVVAVIAFEERASFFSLLGGCAAGALLGCWGVRLTRFEPRSDGMYFHPDRYLGGALAVLLLGRLLWRAVAGPKDGAVNWTLDAFVQNPSTMLLFGLFSAHLAAYALGMIRRMTRPQGAAAVEPADVSAG